MLLYKVYKIAVAIDWD